LCVYDIFDLTIDDGLDVEGTTTINLIKLGDTLSDTSFTRTAGATSTPGGIVTIQYTGADILCGNVRLDITSAPTVYSEWKVTTSTSATAMTGDPGGLIPTSTLATSTAGYFDSEMDGNDVSSWELTNGMYVHLTADQNNTAGNNQNTTSTSADWSSIAGGLYLTDCTTK